MSENEFFSGSPKTMFFSGFVAGVAIIAVFASLYLANMTMSGTDLPAQAEGGTVPTVVDDPTQVEEPAYAAVPGITADDHVLGDPNAAVVLIEYSDFECPFCSRHYPTMKSIAEDYGDQVAIVFRHFPLSFHPEAVPAAQAAECASEQGQFWGFYDQLFQNQTDLGEEFYVQVAGELGLDVAAWQTCYDSDKYVEEIAAEMNAGSAAGVKGTPATFINSQLVSGAVPLETFKAIIDAELE
jgi:protein-disulfide isomerase